MDLISCSTECFWISSQLLCTLIHFLLWFNNWFCALQKLKFKMELFSCPAVCGFRTYRPPFFQGELIWLLLHGHTLFCSWLTLLNSTHACDRILHCDWSCTAQQTGIKEVTRPNSLSCGMGCGHTRLSIIVYVYKTAMTVYIHSALSGLHKLKCAQCTCTLSFTAHMLLEQLNEPLNEYLNTACIINTVITMVYTCIPTH